MTGGSGTGWGWIRVMSPPARRVGHEPNPEYDWERARVEGRSYTVPSSLEVPDAPKDERWYMTAADSAELAELLGLSSPVHCQGESIPASSDYRRFYVARAMGLETTANPTPYWD